MSFVVMPKPKRLLPTSPVLISSLNFPNRFAPSVAVPPRDVNTVLFFCINSVKSLNPIPVDRAYFDASTILLLNAAPDSLKLLNSV